VTRLPSYDAVLTEADSLLVSGYNGPGNWRLGQVCHHLAAVMEMSLDGFPSRLPWRVRLVAHWFVLGRVLKHRVFRRRFAAPDFVQPPDPADDRTGVKRLWAAVERLQGHAGVMQPAPAFGGLSPAQ
jgi:hypothetical protein